MQRDATHAIIAGLAGTAAAAAAAAAAAKGLALRGNRRNRAIVIGQYRSVISSFFGQYT
ncbi:MAG: hypothetical protein ACJAYI_002264 [Myxococcota bacterium]|jgi:hypothetical protein